MRAPKYNCPSRTANFSRIGPDSKHITGFLGALKSAYTTEIDYPAQSANRATPLRLLEYVQLARRIVMSDMRMSTSTSMQIGEKARDTIAVGIWFGVLAGALFLTAYGQSIFMTAGLMFELTAAYSTFVLCGKTARRPFVHAVPYAFALAGALFLCLAPDFQNAAQASLVFLVVTALMHGSVVYGAPRSAPEAEDPVYASAI
jgi:hypothetical protein